MSVNHLDPALEGAEPKNLWGIFDKIRQIPHKSKQEQALMKFLAEFATENGFECRQDQKGNMCIFVPATKGLEDKPSICLQGHADMVCVKDESSNHDFSTDPIQLERDAQFLKAKGTTLGADNGVGLAAALALATDPEAAHPALEILVTVGEEIGLKGANELDAKALGITADKILNLDSEEVGEICVASAGLISIDANQRLERENPGAANNYFEISLSGMQGGHSGANIHENRGNAILAMNRFLQELPFDVRLVSVNGGQAMNAIPAEAKAIIACSKYFDFAALRNVLGKVHSEFDPEWGAHLSIKNITPDQADRDVILADAHHKIVEALGSAQNGVLKMSEFVPSLVQTSSNIGVVDTTKENMKIEASVRSSVYSEMDVAAENLAQVLKQGGFDVTFPDHVSGWQQDPTSPLVRAVADAYKNVAGVEPAIKGIHAGLETGVLVNKLSEVGKAGRLVEAVSFGPSIYDPHSPKERVDMPSVDVFYKQLKSAVEILSA